MSQTAGTGQPPTTPPSIQPPTKPPSVQPTTTPSNIPEIGPRELALAITGIVAVVVIALFAMWWYGSTGETSAVAVLGASVGTIGSIVGAIVGVSVGTKSGSATGAAATSAADAKTKLAKAATKNVKSALGDSLKGLQEKTGLTPRALGAGPMKELTKDELTSHVKELQDAYDRVSDALDSLSE